MWFWLLHCSNGQIKEFCGIYKKESVEYEGEVEQRIQYLDLEICCWFRWPHLAQMVLSSNEWMGEIKHIYALHHYNLRVFLKYRDSLEPHYHGKLY